MDHHQGERPDISGLRGSQRAPEKFQRNAGPSRSRGRRKSRRWAALELSNSSLSSRELLLESSMPLSQSIMLLLQSLVSIEKNRVLSYRWTAEQRLVLLKDEATRVCKQGLSRLRRGLSRQGVKRVAHSLSEPNLTAQ